MQRFFLQNGEENVIVYKCIVMINNNLLNDKVKAVILDMNQVNNEHDEPLFMDVQKASLMKLQVQIQTVKPIRK